ncbi:MAG: phosphate ABC transporter, permease protein PstA, partial [Actinobacteria bacterium]|nr:phosphate ABC transporter, permease protein PstA [Actinomycetota bacterium]
SVGETAAVIFTAGSALRIPTSLFSSSRTMAVHFYILAREGISMSNAYGTAAILVITILIINIVAYRLMNRFIKKYS